jgi:hypothetical protein
LSSTTGIERKNISADGRTANCALLRGPEARTRNCALTRAIRAIVICCG